MWNRFPALTRALALTLCVTVVLYLAARCIYWDSRPRMYLLGDSAIGNYRLDPGQRLQDHLALLYPELRVENLAEPGSAPMDYYLQVTRAEFLAGKPKVALVFFTPEKFLQDSGSRRFDEDGVNLRWLPWNRLGLELFGTLNAHEKSVAVVQQAGLPFFAVQDAARSLWIRYVQWPWERKQMRTAGPSRRTRIEAKVVQEGREEDSVVVPDSTVFSSQARSRDAEFMIRALRSEGTRVFIVILPFGNPNLMQRMWTPKVLAYHDSLDYLMRAWVRRQGMPYLDFNNPGDLSRFPDSNWDDLTHLKAPAAFAYISRRIADTLFLSEPK